MKPTLDKKIQVTLTIAEAQFISMVLSSFDKRAKYGWVISDLAHKIKEAMR